MYYDKYTLHKSYFILNKIRSIYFYKNKKQGLYETKLPVFVQI